MKTITAHVYGKEYVLACDVGQEQHLTKLVSQINARCYELEKAVGKLSEPLMLLYTALMVADELHDTKVAAARTRDELAATQENLAQAQELLASQDNGAVRAALEGEVAGSLEQLAMRLDGLALKLAS